MELVSAIREETLASFPFLGDRRFRMSEATRYFDGLAFDGLYDLIQVQENILKKTGYFKLFSKATTRGPEEQPEKVFCRTLSKRRCRRLDPSVNGSGYKCLFESVQDSL